MKLAVVLAIGLVGVRVADASPTRAERLYAAGQRAYDERHYDDAIAMWERSYEESKLAGLQFNIAQAYRLRAKPGDCERAATHYRAFIEGARQSDERALAESLLAELGTCATVAVAPQASAVAAAPATSAVAASPETNTVATSPQPALNGRGKQLAGYVLVGAGAALAVTAAGFGYEARSIGNSVTSACRTGCNWAVESASQAKAEHAQTEQWVLYGASAAAALAGVTLWALGAHERAPTVEVAPQAGGATVSWSRPW